MKESSEIKRLKKENKILKKRLLDLDEIFENYLKLLKEYTLLKKQRDNK
jgi:hypothetical protein